MCLPTSLRQPPHVPALLHAPQGERIECNSASTEEQAARELRTVEGIGEGTAIVLARTIALGGAKHGSLDSLRSWAGASGERWRLVSPSDRRASQPCACGTMRWASAMALLGRRCMALLTRCSVRACPSAPAQP